MKPIGGYFELELRNGIHYHPQALRLNTARNCLEYILRAKHYKKVYLPYYTCEVVFETLQKCGIEWEYYHINHHFEPVTKFHLGSDEAFLYTNYWGIKQSYVYELAKYYGTKLIVDNAQAFFAPPVPGIDTFYSARKFFGVADGAYLYTDTPLDIDLERDFSSDRMSHLLKRLEKGAESSYSDFIKSETALNNVPIRKMSRLTEKIMESLDYESIKKCRSDNYEIVERSLASTNLLKLNLSTEDVPMVYPYFSDRHLLKENLISQKIFVATYWKNVQKVAPEHSFEYILVDNFIPLPIDQRYDEHDINQYLKIINV